jgi:hypothetical protein
MINGVQFVYNKQGPRETTGENAGKYNGPAFYQTFIMTRREWPTPLG